jgi:TRAP-type mannitol/chloroaromatic compound transport system permease small subunit
MREVHMSVDVPIWPIKFIFFLGWSLLGIQFFIEFINRILSKLDPRGFEQVREGE